MNRSLGASHDGEGDAKDCKAEDHFIMSSALPVFDPKDTYSRNPWMFSNCSVESFKKTLKTKYATMRIEKYSILNPIHFRFFYQIAYFD
ncbi:hypothetical protein CHS0354_026047 [Potamilus streckersoni]|uniref:Peptidase M12B domain-containing protein n=1 Tax=Potamilus streckersoni TaxID=2493646 RepID=A0AAE0SG26_9BIVA|nr:hypothetical protein CHS0354_026047 [Potamilus streckersoni]